MSMGQRTKLRDTKKPFNEEVYELSEEIINKRHEGIEEEIGDLLLHVTVPFKIRRRGKKIYDR